MRSEATVRTTRQLAFSGLARRIAAAALGVWLWWWLKIGELILPYPDRFIDETAAFLTPLAPFWTVCNQMLIFALLALALIGALLGRLIPALLFAVGAAAATPLIPEFYAVPGQLDLATLVERPFLAGPALVAYVLAVRAAGLTAFFRPIGGRGEPPGETPMDTRPAPSTRSTGVTVTPIVPGRGRVLRLLWGMTSRLGPLFWLVVATASAAVAIFTAKAIWPLLGSKPILGLGPWALAAAMALWLVAALVYRLTVSFCEMLFPDSTSWRDSLTVLWTSFWLGRRLALDGRLKHLAGLLKQTVADLAPDPSSVSRRTRLALIYLLVGAALFAGYYSVHLHRPDILTRADTFTMGLEMSGQMSLERLGRWLEWALAQVVSTLYALGGIGR